MEASQQTYDSLMDREQGLIDSLLVRFKNIVELAPMPEGEVTKEVAAAQAFQMEVETTALIHAAEDLLRLTRELKEMWLFGPLRGLGEGEEDGKMGEDVRKVGEMVETLLNEHSGRR